MKKFFSITIMLALSISAFAYDFMAVCPSGDTLYYLILPNDNHEVKVVCPLIYNGIPYYGYPKPEGELIVPETVESEGVAYTVVSIGNYAFISCHDITSVVLPNSIRRIGSGAFCDCTSISSEVIIPDRCTFIGDNAFVGCVSMSSLTIGAAVDTIQWSAFENCTGLQSIYCNTSTPPFSEHLPNTLYYDDRSIFNNVPTDIPVYVNCVTLDQFLLNWDWSRFINIEGVYVGVPDLTVSVNNPDYGTAEIVSIPEDCEHSTATVRATPNPGHSFGYWKRGSHVVSYESEYTFPISHNSSLTACFDSYAIVDNIAFPDHVIGRTINASGQVTYEYPSDFIYDQEGVLTKFRFPAIVVIDFSFNDFPSMPSYIIAHHGGHPIYDNRYIYTYYNNKIKHLYCTNGLSELAADFDYLYDESWHLKRIEHIVEDPGSVDYYYNYHQYEYENNYRTRTDSYYVYDVFTNKTINQYNDRQQLLSSQIDTYNSAGDTTSRKLQTYSYTWDNKTANIITWTFTEGEWTYSSITQYVYDDDDRIVECQTGSWSHENQNWNITKKIVYDFDDDNQKVTVSFRKKNNGEWGWNNYSGQTLFYNPELKEWNRIMSSSYSGLHINQFEFDLHYVTKETAFPWQSEWYYEIVWDDGSTTYQHLECVGDTLINRESKRPKVIVRSNTHYDRDTITEVTHEYIYEEGNKVYWWNKDLQEFTLLYDYNAGPGDEWEIKVGTESIIVHVDNVDIFEYEGDTYKRLYISDEGDIFDGEIVVGFGHMTSFFPEKLMNQGKGFRVDGLRCYWVEDALLYHNGDEDCDAIHSELQNVEEDGPSTPSTGSGTLTIYPNPANNILFVETQRTTSLPDPTYRITNPMGQILLQGKIDNETQQINIKDLTAGMYFISVGEQTAKFVKQ